MYSPEFCFPTDEGYCYPQPSGTVPTSERLPSFDQYPNFPTPLADNFGMPPNPFTTGYPEGVLPIRDAWNRPQTVCLACPNW